MVSRMPFGPKMSSFQFGLPKTSSCISVDSKLSPLFIVAGRISTGPASRKGFAMTRVLVSFEKSPAPCLHPYWFFLKKQPTTTPMKTSILRNKMEQSTVFSRATTIICQYVINR